MEVDFIRWMVGYAEGFEYYEGGQVNDPANFIYTLDNLSPEYRKDMWELIVYPLLLRRAVEGCEHVIIFCNERLTCLSLEDDRQSFDYRDYPKTEYLTPQEQAIEACLIELLEEK